MTWCYAWRFRRCEATRLTLGVPLNAVAFRGMVGGWQAARPAGLGSRGCQSPGMVDTCVRSRRECDVRRSTARAAAKKG